MREFLGVCTIALCTASGSAADAETLGDFLQRGYVQLWSGYAGITTCVHGQDHYALGPYVFVCDQFTYEYPYYYGEVTLIGVAKSAVPGARLCLGPQRGCIAGTIFRR